MDYGSLYGMGSYFGEDYTAANLVRLATLTQDALAKVNGGKALSELTMEQRASVKAAMQAELQGVDLTKQVAVIPDPLAAALGEIVMEQRLHDLVPKRGDRWTQAYGLDQESAEQTADFLVYSSLTTVARRPGTDASWTDYARSSPAESHAKRVSSRWQRRSIGIRRPLAPVTPFAHSTAAVTFFGYLAAHRSRSQFPVYAAFAG